ncbi:uncharacterized protein LOC135370969 [Ornithodoros turicata]|uniref:Uncharacterized protein n=1 Tax=Ornithodoros turicata TaxID=34597 RepID=A0A2R5LI64_9ACAR
MSGGFIQLPYRFSEDIRTLDSGPLFERKFETNVRYESDPQQYRTTLEMKKRYIPSHFCSTMVIDLETMEQESYKETLEVVSRIVPVGHGETVFSFEKEPCTVYTSSVTYDTRSVDYWYTSGVDLIPIERPATCQDNNAGSSGQEEDSLIRHEL